MNDLDEFAEVALAIFLALTLLIWLLTYLERTLIQPVTEKRAGRGIRRKKNPVSPAPPDDN
jgi:glutamine phosphoribosylpyrophosphate amidotransferase